MHIPKQEFQVLDSLYSLSTTKKIIETMVIYSLNFIMYYLNTCVHYTNFCIFQRYQIAYDIKQTNMITKSQYPDVSKWPIKRSELARQRDG